MRLSEYICHSLATKKYNTHSSHRSRGAACLLLSPTRTFGIFLSGYQGPPDRHFTASPPCQTCGMDTIK
jgi:hypothetical protein